MTYEGAHEGTTEVVHFNSNFYYIFQASYCHLSYQGNQKTAFSFFENWEKYNFWKLRSSC